MTIEDYRWYSAVTTTLFQYMNGRINTLNKYCELHIMMYDLATKNFGTINYPNYITIYLGNIIDSWNEEWKCVLSKNDYIGSCIAWAIAHELHHADQLISMLQYNVNASYKQQVENDVERASYDWVKRHAKTINNMGAFKVRLDMISSPTLVAPRYCDYTKASIKDFYLQTIMNVIIRDANLFYKFREFVDDDYVDAIILVFGSDDKVIIKYGKEWLQENIPRFSYLAYNYAGIYDRYGIKVTGQIRENTDKTRISEIMFSFNDQMIYPIIAGKEYKDLIDPIIFN